MPEQQDELAWTLIGDDEETVLDRLMRQKRKIRGMQFEI